MWWVFPMKLENLTVKIPKKQWKQEYDRRMSVVLKKEKYGEKSLSESE